MLQIVLYIRYKIDDNNNKMEMVNDNELTYS